MLRTAYEDAALSSAQVLRWYKAFKEDHGNIEDEHRESMKAYRLCVLF